MSTRSTRTGARATTSAEAALRFAQTLAGACAGALGKTVAGVILHGSLTLDDYIPGRSDLDLLVVIDDPLGDARLAALAEAMASRRAQGRSLLGAAPAELIGEVSDRWVVAAGDAQLAAWQAIGDDPPYAELTVLTACRVWRFVEEGGHASKTAAAEWALGRDPTLGVVGDALRRRHGDPAARIDPAQVARLLAVVRARLAEARDRA